MTRDIGLGELILRVCRDRLDLVVFSPRHKPTNVARVMVKA